MSEETYPRYRPFWTATSHCVLELHILCTKLTFPTRGPKLFRHHRFFLFVFLMPWTSPSAGHWPPRRPPVRPSTHRPPPESGFSTPTSSSFSPLSPEQFIATVRGRRLPSSSSSSLAVQLSYGIISLMSSTSLFRRKSTKARGSSSNFVLTLAGKTVAVSVQSRYFSSYVC